MASTTTAKPSLSNETPCASTDGEGVEWALLKAGAQNLVVLAYSPGRSPVGLLCFSPVVKWKRADGGIEWLGSGEARDLAPLQRDIMGKGLLVAEYQIGQSASAHPATSWILKGQGREA